MGELDQGQYDRTEEVSYVNGCRHADRARALEEVGYWDPSFSSPARTPTVHAAEGRRLRCFYTPTAILWHMVSHTAGSYVPNRTFGTGR